MKFVLIIVGIIFLVISWQISQASGITTSIAGTGVSFLNTAVIGEERSYSNSLFTEGRSAVIRAIDTRTGILSDVLVKSSGSIGIDEYGDLTGKNSPGSVLNCVFSPVNTSDRYSMVSTMGLLQGGEYQSRKTIGNGLRSHTLANTTGLVMTKAKSETENISEYGKTVVSGNMSLAEDVEFSGGGRDD